MFSTHIYNIHKRSQCMLGDQRRGKYYSIRGLSAYKGHGESRWTNKILIPK